MSSELPSRNVVTESMQRGPEQGVDAQRMLQGVWRRRKLCLALAVVVLAVGAGVVTGTPDVYRAEVAVRVEPARLSPELLTPSVTQQIEDRLKTIQSELFARPLLVRVVQEQDLYPELVKKKGLDAAAVELRRHLDVKVEGDNSFDLTVEDASPAVAAAIANRLPELFAQEALKIREDQAEEAQELFGDELSKLSHQLAGQEQKINEFKLAHLGELPEQMESNMRGLERLTVLLGQRSDSIRDAQRRLQDASRGHLDADSDAGRLAHRESDLRTALDAARSQYLDDHPEVQRLQRELNAVHSQRNVAEAEARAADTTRAEAASELAALNRESDTMQQQVDVYRQRIDNTPRWSVPLAELEQQYDVLKTKYQQMVSKKVDAELDHDHELRARAQMFHVLSPAEVPAAPIRPDRTAGFLLVTLLAIALALLAGVAVELQDDTLREVSDAHQVLQLAVLATVPDLGRKPVLGTGKTLRPAPNQPRGPLDA